MKDFSVTCYCWKKPGDTAFGNVYKITLEMFAAWMEILKEIPRAILWLIDDNTTTTTNLKTHAIKAGADIDRILFTPRASHEDYRAKLKLADVFLDTFPNNCGSTTNDVMNAGLPLITMSDRTMASRMGGNILSMFKSNRLAIHEYTHYKDQCQMIATLGSSTDQSYIGRKSSLSEAIETYSTSLYRS